MMSTSSKAIPGIPKETVRAAYAILGRNNFYIRVGDQLEHIWDELEGECLQGRVDFPKVEDIMLSLITFFQFVEGLTDLQAIDAARTRTDWKFALHLSLFPATLHEDALCRFRQRILDNPDSQRQFQGLIDRLIDIAPSISGISARLASLDVVSLVCSLNSLHLAQQAMDQALEVLAVRFPQWLRKNALPHWYGRYNPAVSRTDEATLQGQKRFVMEEIAADIQQLLAKVHQSGSLEMSELPEVYVLDQLWGQQSTAFHCSANARLETLSLKDCENCSMQRIGRRHAA